MKLTLQDWLTSSGRFPWRATHIEVTEQLKTNAQAYLDKLNAVIVALYIKNAKFSSGFRPSDVNKKTPNAALHSNHVTGHAGDLEDPRGDIYYVFALNLELLAQHGLYMENSKDTLGWCHTQDIAPKSGNRIFIA
jgi:hypothetical protein